MRTTLDIDDDVLQAAKELAKAEGKTAGQIASALMRKALSGPSGSVALKIVNGIPVLPAREGVVVTKELVDRLIEEADWEDAGLEPPAPHARAP